MNGSESSQYQLTRFWFQRALGSIYLLAFIIAANQYLPLLGAHGLLPVRLFLPHVNFWSAPGLFWLNASDAVMTTVIWLGIGLSVLAATGISEKYGMAVSVGVWSLLWVLYQSLVNAGQAFYGFGWEMILLETGFLAIFLGSNKTHAPQLIIWLLRWELFRIMFGAGMIKIRGDTCWRDLTCMVYHYETQPLPNPLSWYFHRLPLWINQTGVLFNHFVELVVPWFFFTPNRKLRTAAGILTIIFQVMLILSGNLSWLNYITIAICLACFDDAFLSRVLPRILNISPRETKGFQERPEVGVSHVATSNPATSPLSPPGERVGVRGNVNCLSRFMDKARARHAPSGVKVFPSGPMSLTRRIIIGLLAASVLLLSIQPAMNLFSEHQAMNASFDPIHLVNTYGAFGSITRERDEIILEGTDSPQLDATAVWREYEFKGKPGNPHRPPCLVAPYQYKLDWQMWFAAMSSYEYHPWIINLVAKLLTGDKPVLSLLANNPFPATPPRYIRATLYHYQFTATHVDGNWWKRERLREYLPPLSLEDPDFRRILEQQGWLE